MNISSSIQIIKATGKVLIEASILNADVHPDLFIDAGDHKRSYRK
jgi:hypothetical protein